MKKLPVIIVGAGQSGLAMSRELSRRGVEHLVLEKGVIANAWRAERWDSLRLLTPNWASALPGAPYSGPAPHDFMSVSAFADRVDAYASAIAAPVQSDTTVRKASSKGGGYRLETNQGAFWCEALVLATGACAAPKIPRLATDVPSGVFQTSPVDYRRPSGLPEGGVLVVGASASGVQLACEIQRSGRQTILSVGAHLRLPRRYGGSDIEWWLDATGVLDERWDQVEDLARARRAPSPQLIGAADPVDLNALQRQGVEIVGRLMDIRNGAALFSGGLGHHCAAADLKQQRLLDQIDAWAVSNDRVHPGKPPNRPASTACPRTPRLTIDLLSGEIGTVIWATGYRPDFSWLDLPVFDARGNLRHDGGVADAPGLYAMGLPFLRRRRSQQISGAGPDAGDLAAHLHRHLDAQRAA